MVGGGYLWAVCSVPDINLPGALHMSQNPEVLPFCRTARLLSSKVLAPGTEKDSVVRLKNDTNKEITYTAVLYSLSTSPDLDIGATLSGDGFSDTSRYTLPENIKKEAVILK